jgi:hypothetical protein
MLAVSGGACVAVVACFSVVRIDLLASEKTDAAARDSDELAVLMRAKLASSQKVMEGLLVKDFDAIRKGGQELQRISEATKWYAHTDPIYAQHRSELGRQAGKLVQVAEEKNLDAAAYTYLRSLTTCISCHDHCRDVLHLKAVQPHPNAVTPIPTTISNPSR